MDTIIMNLDLMKLIFSLKHLITSISHQYCLINHLSPELRSLHRNLRYLNMYFAFEMDLLHLIPYLDLIIIHLHLPI